MITPAFGLTATERVLPKLALDFTTAALDARVAVTRTTNATNPATYIDSSGVITAATNNQPRFDYDPVTLLCRGLLIEESRANSLLNTDLLATQIVTVTAAVRTFSFYGTGSVTLSGAHSAVVSGTGVYPTRTTYSFTPSAGALTLTVTGTVQFAQLEAGAFATSYIPTTTTSLTRNADTVSMTGTNFSDWYNASEGTFVAKADTIPFNGALSGSLPILNVNDNTTNNVFGLRFDTGGTNTAMLMTIGGANQGTVGLFNAVSGQNKISANYKSGNRVGSLNAATVKTGTYVGSLSVDRIRLGSDATGSYLNGTLQQVRYYPQALLNAELQSVTK